jgi:hypothetical protein
MPVLRLTQTTVRTDQYCVEIAIEGDGQPRSMATSQFQFILSSQEQEDIRWYLEDFLQYDLKLEAKRGEKIEQKIVEIGSQLFEKVFYSNNDARDLWTTLRSNINDTRIEIVTEVFEAATIPWELIYDSKTQIFLSLRASSFVRTHPTAAQVPQVPQISPDPVRILLVICRPEGEKDESRGSIVSQMTKKLNENACGLFQLETLDQQTFEELGRVLRKAKNQGKPYHIVHFDGHGIYAEMIQTEALAEQIYQVRPLVLSQLRSGSHGYLLFENPKIPENIQFVDGATIGNLLVETEVPLLILNACRSAHAEPLRVENQEKKTLLVSDSHTQVRALGTLAQEVMETGVVGVVAMRYNVYVDTAVQFVADLYEALTQGLTLGEAVTQGRKQLNAQPLRKTPSDTYPLQDWFVPFVYEAIPFSLFLKLSQNNHQPEKIFQEVATNLNAEMEAVGLAQPNEAIQTIETRLQRLPAIFAEGLCRGRPLRVATNQYFVSHGFEAETLTDWRETLTETLANLNGSKESFQPYFAGDSLLGGFRLCGIVEKLYTTRFSAFLLPLSKDRNVYLELGIAIGLGTPFFLIQHYQAQIPPILEGLDRYKSGSFRKMRRELAGQIEEYDFGIVRFISNLPTANSQPNYVIGSGELIDDEDFEGSIAYTMERTHPHLEALSLTEQLNTGGSGWVLEQLVEAIQTSRFGIYRVNEDCSATTFLALGISIGLSRPFLMIHQQNQDVPLDLQGMGIYKFPNFVTLKQQLISQHKKFFQKYA